MRVGIGLAVVLKAVRHGLACLSVCKYALLSPIESQNSLVGALLHIGWVWARLRGEDVELSFYRQNSGLVD